MNLELRKDIKNNKAYYYAKLRNGVVYSVINLGEVMKSAPEFLKKVSFNGWEAMMISNDELKTETMIRKDSREEILDELKKKDFSDVSTTINSEAIPSRTFVDKLLGNNKKLNLAEMTVTESGIRIYHFKPKKVGSCDYWFKFHSDGRISCINNDWQQQSKDMYVGLADKEHILEMITTLINIYRIME